MSEATTVADLREEYAAILTEEIRLERELRQLRIEKAGLRLAIDRLERHRIADEETGAVGRVLSEAQWRLIASCLPGKDGDPGRSGKDNRATVEGMLWIARTGRPWRDLPPEFGNWNSVYRRFRRWRKAGVLAELSCLLGHSL